MKKLITFLALAALCLYGNISAKEVNLQLASEVAKNFAAEIHSTKSDLPETNIQQPVLLGTSRNLFGSDGLQSAGTSAYYIFSLNPGWCIISGDDNSRPILAYSPDNNLDITKIPDNAEYWFKLYNNEVKSTASSDENQISAFSDQWQRYKTGKKSAGKVLSVVVSPLVKSTWGQQYPYYNLCPMDGSNRSVTGCVATAMAQIINFWKWPLKGTSYHSYVSETKGFNLAANFDTTYFDWNNITNSYDSASCTSAQALAVATLMYDCGVSVDMDYSASGSGAYSNNVPAALTSYFGYSDSCIYLDRTNYTLTQWNQILQNELDAGRPMLYSGYDRSAGGHAFVCDGYDSDMNFHYNFGWDGQANGYFASNAVSPGSYSFNTNQSVVKNIIPLRQSNLNISQTFTLSGTAKINNPLIVKAKFVNSGTAAFSGKLVMRLFAKSDTLRAIVDLDSADVNSLAAGSSTQVLTFTSMPLRTISAGDYVIFPFVEITSGQYSKILPTGTAAGKISVAIAADDEHGELSLNAQPTISPASLLQGDIATYDVPSVKNNTETDFNGTIYAYVIQASTQNVFILDSIPNFSVSAGTIKSLSRKFNLNTESLPIGNYFIAAFSHNNNNDSNSYVNADGYNAFLSMQVSDLPEGADKYENNNTKARAYVFSDTNIVIDANIHKNDVDYYYLTFDQAKRYDISIVGRDAGNDGNYTCDVQYRVFTDNESSAADNNSNFDGTFIRKTGVYIRVKPVNSQSTGTYSLTISIVKSPLYEPDQYEVNNTAETAYDIPYAENTIIDANIHQKTDKDYYKIKLDSTKKYKLSYLIYDSKTKGDTCTANAGITLVSGGIEYNEGNASYDLSIKNADSVLFIVNPNVMEADVVGSYRLVITIAEDNSVAADKYEPNETKAAAYKIPFAEKIDIDASIHSNSDVDYYQINLDKNKKYTFKYVLYDKTNSSGAYTANAEMTLISGYDYYTESQIGYGLALSNTDNIVINVVSPISSKKMGTYLLHIELIESTSTIDADKYEVNNTEATAYAVPYSNSANLAASIHDSADVDYYKIVFPADSTYSVTITPGAGSTSPSVNVKYSVKIGNGEFSSEFGEAETINVSASDSICIFVKPQETNAAGYYSLGISTAAKAVSGVKDADPCTFRLAENSGNSTVEIISPCGAIAQHVIIYDISGNSVDITGEYLASSRIDISRLVCGKYFVEITSSGNRYLLDFIK